MPGGCLQQRCEASPDLTTVRRRPHHGIAGMTVEGLGKCGHVGRRSDSPETVEWMRVRVHHEALEFRTLVGSPNLGEGHEDALFGPKAVNLGRARLARQAVLKCLISDGQSAQVRDA